MVSAPIWSGRLHSTDFGLARITEETGLSVSGEVIGTYLYMSPEQVSAKRAEVDHRTDIYSLSVVSYELLALQRPYEGDTTAHIAMRILRELQAQAKQPWPPIPEGIGDDRDWLSRAELLVSQLDPSPDGNDSGRRAQLAALEQRALESVEYEASFVLVLDVLAWACFANGLEEEALETHEMALDATWEERRPGIEQSAKALRTAIEEAPARLSSGRRGAGRNRTRAECESKLELR